MQENVCFFHSQVDNKWQWFIADKHGRNIKNFGTKFDTIEEARKSYDENVDTVISGLVLTDK